ncbi:hypothetical protein AWZ03_015513, partial [Drosophila navojoa]
MSGPIGNCSDKSRKGVKRQHAPNDELQCAFEPPRKMRRMTENVPDNAENGNQEHTETAPTNCEPGNDHSNEGGQNPNADVELEAAPQPQPQPGLGLTLVPEPATGTDVAGPPATTITDAAEQ